MQESVKKTNFLKASLQDSFLLNLHITLTSYSLLIEECPEVNVHTASPHNNIIGRATSQSQFTYQWVN